MDDAQTNSSTPPLYSAWAAVLLDLGNQRAPPPSGEAARGAKNVGADVPPKPESPPVANV